MMRLDVPSMLRRIFEVADCRINRFAVSVDSECIQVKGVEGTNGLEKKYKYDMQADQVSPLNGRLGSNAWRQCNED